MTGCGTALCGIVWHCVVQYGEVCHDMKCYTVVWHGMLYYSVVWYCVVMCGKAQHGILCYGAVQYGAVEYCVVTVLGKK